MLFVTNVWTLMASTDTRLLYTHKTDRNRGNSSHQYHFIKMLIPYSAAVLTFSCFIMLFVTSAAKFYTANKLVVY
jgi:hypothetical protein